MDDARRYRDALRPGMDNAIEQTGRQKQFEADVAWLRSLRETGHCGEGLVEIKRRGVVNDRIDRLLAMVETWR